MLSLARATLRTRAASLAGALAALTLGVAVLATTALVLAAAFGGSPHQRPQRYAAAPVVVRADPDLHVRDRYGTADAVPYPEQPPLPAAALARFPGAVPDRTFPLHIRQIRGDLVGHPWSSTAFTPSRLTAGRAPARSDEIAIGGGTPALIGQAVTVSTRDRTGTYRITAVTAPVAFEHAVFFTDRQAAALSPPVDALVMTTAPPPGTTTGLQVLTGAARHRADPQYAQDTADLTGLQGFLGVAALLAGCVCLYVTAAAFGLSVTRRRRELALLRLTGATPAQVVGTVCAEAALTGVAGSASGCVLALLGGPRLAVWMASRRLAPDWFRVHLSGASLVALALAFTAGIAVSVAAVAVPSIRAGMIRPTEALREAAADRRPVTRARRVLGLACLVCAAGALAAVAFAFPQAASDLKTDVELALLLVTAAATLAPLAVPALVRAATRPLARGATATLVRGSVLTQPRRCAATVAPWLITVALAAAVLGSADTAGAAGDRALHDQAAAARFVVTPAAGSHTLTADALAALAGAATTTAVTDTTVLAHQPALTRLHFEAPMPIPFPAIGVDRPDLLHLPVTHGSLADLAENTVAVDSSWHKHVGDTLTLWLPDGRPAVLRVIAVLQAGPGIAPVVLNAKDTGRALPDRAYTRPRPGTSPDALRGALRAAGADLRPTAAWTASVTDRQAAQSRLGLVVLLGISLGYSAIASVSSFATLVAGRRRELETLRLSGAVRRQIVGGAAAEAAALAVAATVLAALVAAAQLAAMSLALAGPRTVAPVVAPWPLLAAIAATGTAVAVASAALAAALATRPQRPASSRPAPH